MSVTDDTASGFTRSEHIGQVSSDLMILEIWNSSFKNFSRLLMSSEVERFPDVVCMLEQRSSNTRYQSGNLYLWNVKRSQQYIRILQYLPQKLASNRWEITLGTHRKVILHDVSSLQTIITDVGIYIYIYTGDEVWDREEKTRCDHCAIDQIFRESHRDNTTIHASIFSFSHVTLTDSVEY